GYPRKEEERKEEQVPYKEYEKRLRAFIGVARAFNIEPVLMTQPIAKIHNALTPDWPDPRNQEVFNYTIRKVGVEEGVVVIDLARHLIENVGDWNQPMKIFYDRVHVNDRGSEVYAEYIAEHLLSEVLARRIKK